MIQSKMIEKEEEFVCSMNHKNPIQMVVCDKNIDKNKRFLCSECIYSQDSQLNNVMCFKKVSQLIQENQKKKVELVEDVIKMNIHQINELKQTLNQIKSWINQQLDQIISNTEEWIICLLQIGQQNVNYSFYEELGNLNQIQIGDFDYTTLNTQIYKFNHSWNKKIIQKLNEFKSFELMKKCEQLLNNLENVNYYKDSMNQIGVIQKQQQDNDNVRQKQCDVEFKLINDFSKQTYICYSIVFNNNGSIMISTDGQEILVWNFTQGKFQKSNRFKVHLSSVSCLVYSKKMNCFISGSWDISIICWKLINNNEWQWSQPYKQHTNWVFCLTLNKQEDKLISGGRDNSINIWNVDFIKNELTYCYSLDNTAAVYSLSLNQSETLLASCAKNHYLIWVKGVDEQWQLNCMIDKKKNISQMNQILKQINSQQLTKISFSIKNRFLREIKYTLQMINNFFGQQEERILIKFRSLNYKMKSSNRIKTKQSNQLEMINVRMILQISQLYRIQIKIFCW